MVTVFAKSTGGVKVQPGGGGNAIPEVEFVNTYKNFKKAKGKDTQIFNEELERIKDDCRARIGYFSDKFVELVTGATRANKFNQVEALQRILKGALRRKSLSLLEAIMDENSEAWFQLLMTDEPSQFETEQFMKVINMWRSLEELSPDQFEETADEFVKTILQNRILNEEICKLVIFLTTKNV